VLDLTTAAHSVLLRRSGRDARKRTLAESEGASTHAQRAYLPFPSADCAGAASVYVCPRQRSGRVPEDQQVQASRHKEAIPSWPTSPTPRELSAGISLAQRLVQLPTTLSARLANYRTYRATLAQLSALSDRDLDDVGLTAA
jgi:uncharacterized protein YjiS (DUF1127 family)